MEKVICPVAKIYTEFPEKFGIPRQSGLVSTLRGKILFEPEYRSMDAVRGIEEYSHLWLLWDFSKARKENVSLTVTPPRLGGKIRKGVFAARSPYRPNGIGLSSVKLEEVYFDEKEGPILIVSGADRMNETPIFDIKPYLPYTDSHPEAKGSFGEAHKEDSIPVDFPEELLLKLPENLRESAKEVLAQDPRAAYNKKPDYVYGMAFSGYDIRCTVEEQVLHVKDVVCNQDGNCSKVKGLILNKRENSNEGDKRMKKVEDYVRSIPDFPEKGIIFRDVTSVLQDADGLQLAIDEMKKLLNGVDCDVIAGTESRGFIFGMPLAYLLKKPFVLVRKAGKLPCETISKTYDLEYGSATIEIHKDAIKPGQKVVLVDDLIATGGTMKAAAELVEELGGEVVKILFLMELAGLEGRKVLDKYDVAAVVTYEGK